MKYLIRWWSSTSRWQKEINTVLECGEREREEGGEFLTN
jgi:hypothetical protein